MLSSYAALNPNNRRYIANRPCPEMQGQDHEQVELEAVHSRQVYLLHWRELTDASLWRQGWV